MARILRNPEKYAPPQGASSLSGSHGSETAEEITRMIDQRIAARIRERRRRLGMTQQRLAGMVGVAFQQVHKYERGLSRISAGRLYVLAKALKAPMSYFFAANGDAIAPKPQSRTNGGELPEAAVHTRSCQPSARRFVRDGRGGVAVMVAVMAPVLMLFAGVAAEVGMWYSIKRQNQSAVDEAAISAVIENKEGYACPSADVTGVTTAAATYNGFNSAAPNSLTINCNYTDAYLTSLNVTNAVEVISAQKQDALFASFALPFVTIRNRAVAALVPASKICAVLALDGGPVGSPYYFGPSYAINQSDSIYIAGGNGVSAPGLCSNSNDVTSIFFQGGQAGNNTSYINSLVTMGNWAEDKNYNAVISNPEPFSTPPYADPYAGKVSYAPVTTPPVPFVPGTSGPSINPDGTANNIAYCPMALNGTVALKPGAYIIEGEDNQGNGLAVESSAVISGTGVTFILTSVPTGITPCSGGKGGLGGTVYMKSGSQATLSAPTTAMGGIPSGLLFYQDPAPYGNPANLDTSCVHSNLDVSNCNQIFAGPSGWSLFGVSDTPATTMSFSGNANSQCFLVYALAIFFNGTTNSTFSATPSACEGGGVHYPGIPTIALLE